jgi:hypothetical protein
MDKPQYHKGHGSSQKHEEVKGYFLGGEAQVSLSTHADHDTPLGTGRDISGKTGCNGRKPLHVAQTKVTLRFEDGREVQFSGMTSGEMLAKANTKATPPKVVVKKAPPKLEGSVLERRAALYALIRAKSIKKSGK